MPVLLAHLENLLATLVATSPAGAFTWPDAAFHIERDLSSPDAGVRKAAADRLRILAPGVAAPLMLKALGDPDPNVRIAAAHSAITRRPRRLPSAIA